MMEQKTALEQIDGLYVISEFMDDKELTEALEFIAKVILQPDIPQRVIVEKLIKLQAIAAKMAMMGTYMANVDKTDRPKKNLYFTAADQLNLLCQTLKYGVRM